MIGVVLILSTSFTYLFVKEVCNSSNIALFSVLLLSFASFHIRWTIVVIATSFGLALYSIIIYLIIKSNSANIDNKIKYQSLLVFFILVIIWTHTISAFITLITVICLYLSSLINQKTLHLKVEEKIASFTLCLTMGVALTFHWMDQQYSFFDLIVTRLFDSLSAEAKFLDLSVSSNIIESYGMLLLTFGFLIYTFFGIIGSLYIVSKFQSSYTKISLLFTVLVLYVFRYIFPIFGMENIVPDRWPAFIYVIFVLFISIGFFKTLSLIKNPKKQISAIFIILFIASFFMITNNETNLDSPIYGEDVIQRLVWTDSEMALFTHVNKSYDNVIVADKQTKVRPFETYLCRDRHKLAIYPSNEKGEINWNLMNDKLIIWRKTSLTRPLTCSSVDLLLGHDFEARLHDNFSCIYNTGEARAFINFKIRLPII
jgi:ABC-type multidrug transport system fused ATPase/permease subunit